MYVHHTFRAFANEGLEASHKRHKQMFGKVGRGGGKYGSLGNALEKVIYKMFRILTLRATIQTREQQKDWKAKEEARLELYNNFQERKKKKASAASSAASRKRQYDDESRRGLHKKVARSLSARC